MTQVAARKRVGRHETRSEVVQYCTLIAQSRDYQHCDDAPATANQNKASLFTVQYNAMQPQPQPTTRTHTMPPNDQEPGNKVPMSRPESELRIKMDTVLAIWF